MSILAALAPVAAGFAALELLALKVGDCRVRLALDQIADKTLYFADDAHACLRFSVPFRNTGKQQGLIIDAHAQLQPAGELYGHLQPVTRWVNPGAPRTDGYWEACILKPGLEMSTRVEMWLTASDIRKELEQLSLLRVDCYYKSYCRGPMTYMREEIVLPLSEFAEVSESPVIYPPATGSKKKKSDGDGMVVPLRTGLLRPGDDILEVAAKQAAEHGQRGDLIALAETAVAITQGRIAYCEDIKPRYLAYRLNRLFQMDASMSSPLAMEMAMREVGLPRILTASAAGVFGKLVGRSGDFYRLAGRSVATIDDCTGTLPPFDKHVVMGPARGDDVVMAIRDRTGLDAAIVDANDLGKVDVLHISDRSREAEVVEALKPNPQGNAGEMTPLVLIRRQPVEEAVPAGT